MGRRFFRRAQRLPRPRDKAVHPLAGRGRRGGAQRKGEADGAQKPPDRRRGRGDDAVSHGDRAGRAAAADL